MVYNLVFLYVLNIEYLEKFWKQNNLKILFDLQFHELV